jgi:hypothetical protein
MTCTVGELILQMDKTTNQILAIYRRGSIGSSGHVSNNLL